MNKIITLALYFFSIVVLISCKKENCEETIGRKMEVKIFDSNNINVTNTYELDSVFIIGDCNTPGLNPAYGYPQQHLDSLIEFSLGRCCLSDSSKYTIRLNGRQNQYIKDSFLIRLTDFNQCNSCSIDESKSLTDQNNFDDNGTVIKVKVFE